MFGWLRKRAVVQPDNQNVILNNALHLAMEWGEHWLRPVQGRLATLYPHLLTEQLDEYNAISQAAMKYGHEQTYKLAEEKGKNVDFKMFEPIMISRYPWVNAKNLSRLFSQGMYYAWKDGLHG